MVGVDQIMQHAKPNHPEHIASIGISTGWDETGRWEISNIEGSSKFSFFIMISVS